MPERKIEVYGDSVYAGEVSEAVEYTGKEDPEYNGEYSNSWYSYAWMTARKLNAQIHDIAQGGIALKDIIQDGFMNLKLSVWKQRGIKFIIIRSSEKRKNGILQDIRHR